MTSFVSSLLKVSPRLTLFMLLSLAPSLGISGEATTGSPIPPAKVSDIEPQFYAPTSVALMPKRRISEIEPGSSLDQVIGLKNVKALKIDIPLAKRDFPFMKSWPVEKIYRWFEKVAGVVSVAQTQQAVVNTPIETVGPIRPAFRPPGYGRAVVIEFEEDGFKGALEVKMSGVAGGRFPSHAPHSNGLGTLGEVIREDQFENATRATIAHALRQQHQASSGTTGDLTASILGGTVAGYGVMYAGYDVRHADGSTSPAGIYIRQAHRRLSYDESIRAAWLPGDLKAEVLKHISKYGFYTGWESNLQGLIDDEKVYIFDFGHWIAWQGFVPESGVWVDPSVGIDFGLWGWDSHLGPDRAFDQWRTSKLDRPWLWAHQVANSLWQREAQRYVVQHYDNMLTPLYTKLSVGLPPQRLPTTQSPARNNSASLTLTCRKLFRQNSL